MTCMTILFFPINDDVFVIMEQIFMEYIYYMRNIIILISKDFNTNKVIKHNL